MPEVTPAKNLEMYRQCEIRRPSLPATMIINDQKISKSEGYYFDIVWIKNGLVQKGSKIIDGDNNEWIVAELFGSKPMGGSRGNFKLLTE